MGTIGVVLLIIQKVLFNTTLFELIHTTIYLFTLTSPSRGDFIIIPISKKKKMSDSNASIFEFIFVQIWHGNVVVQTAQFVMISCALIIAIFVRKILFIHHTPASLNPRFHMLLVTSLMNVLNYLKCDVSQVHSMYLTRKQQNRNAQWKWNHVNMINRSYFNHRCGNLVHMLNNKHCNQNLL